MALYSINVISTNQKSLSKFFNLFLKISKTTPFSFINKINRQKSKKKIITMLKSPHVNKKAQEQFEMSYFNYKFNLYSPQEFKLIILFKKLQKKLFTDIRIKIKVISNKAGCQSKKQKILNPLSIRFENPVYSNFNSIDFKKSFVNVSLIKKSLQNLDMYGETFFEVSVAQRVEQRTENPCVDSSNLSLDKKSNNYEKLFTQHVCQYQKWAGFKTKFYLSR